MVKYFCPYCLILIYGKTSFNRHLKTNKHYKNFLNKIDLFKINGKYVDNILIQKEILN